jgi:aminocarboxymuconate-semialdehyde decarboxylase
VQQEPPAHAIDMHAHMVPPEVVAFLEREGSHFDTRIVERESKRFFLIAETAMRPINDEILGTNAGTARLVVMDAELVDVEVVSCVPFVMYPGVSAELGLAIAQISNDAIVAFARNAPERFVPIASVPIQVPDLAARELERAARLGMRGVMIPPLVNGRGLDEPEFGVFWEAAETTGLPVFMHPFDAAPQGPLARYNLGNFVGNPYDTGLGAVLVICGGVLERHPGLRILLAHSGGALASIIGRTTNGYARSADMQRNIPRPPDAYLDRFWYDTIAYNTRLLRALVDTYGADRFVVGTDYPVGTRLHPVADVRALGLDPTREAMILRENAQALLTIA